AGPATRGRGRRLPTALTSETRRTPSADSAHPAPPRCSFRKAAGWQTRRTHGSYARRANTPFVPLIGPRGPGRARTCAQTRVWRAGALGALPARVRARSCRGAGDERARLALAVYARRIAQAVAAA